MPQIANIPGLILDRAHPLSRGLVGWWPLNEAGGTRAADMVSGNFGTLTNGPTWAGSTLGSAVKLDGANDYISIPHSPALAITADITVAIWSMMTTATGYMQLVNKSANPSPYPRPFQLTQVGGTGAMIWGRGNGSAPGGTDAVVSNAVAPVGRWSHWAGTWANGVFKIYYNGGFDNSATASPTCSDGGLPVYIGTRADGAATLWSGGTAHLRIYNRALSALEIAQLYADPMAGARPQFSIARTFIGPPRPSTADRLHNRSFSRIYRRGES